MIAYTETHKLRHFTKDGERTACGLLVKEIEQLPLPVNCNDCRYANGENSKVIRLT